MYRVIFFAAQIRRSKGMKSTTENPAIFRFYVITRCNIDKYFTKW